MKLLFHESFEEIAMSIISSVRKHLESRTLTSALFGRLTMLF